MGDPAEVGATLSLGGLGGGMSGAEAATAAGPERRDLRTTALALTAAFAVMVAMSAAVPLR